MPTREPLARLVRRLEEAGSLGERERQAVLSLRLQPRLVPARADIGVEQDPQAAHLVLRGMACRYHMLSDGTRSIVGLFFPGDLCGGHSAPPVKHHGSLGALSPSLVADVPLRTLEVLVGDHPGIGRALWWLALVELGIAQQWLANGGKEAERRIAHLVCEIVAWSEAAGMAAVDAFSGGIRQGVIADLAAVSLVHVNRVLHALQDAGLIRLERGVVKVPKPSRLAAYADFDAGYLHLAGRAATEPGSEVSLSCGTGRARIRASAGGSGPGARPGSVDGARPCQGHRGWR